MSDGKKTEKITLEEAFEQIEGIIEQMEQQDVTLEESFGLYQSGVEKLKLCTQLLDAVEKKMQVIREDGELTEF